jgi:hypothetical protein
MKDSTSNNNHATSQGGMTAASNQITGQIGNSIDLDGVDDYFTAPHSSSLDITGNQVTLEAWARIPVGGSAQDSPFIMKADSGNQERYMLGVDGGPDPAPINHRVTTATGHWRYDTGSMITGTWEHVVMVYDGSLGSNPRFFTYMDGNLVSSSNASGNILTASTGVQLGKRVDARWYDGDFDELRISNIARSADWIQTEYNNQSNPSSFYRVGSSSCFLGGFSCNRKITVPQANVSGSTDLSNFPLLIKTDNDCKLRTVANGGSVQNSNGWDIIFTDSGGTTQLAHELVSYDAVTGDLVVWVKIPTLSATSDTDIYMYYGKSDMTCDPSNPAGVWDSNYKGVWHLDETSGTHFDSTTNDNDGTAQGGVNQNATGKIGGADDFDGSNDYVDIGQPANGSLDFMMDSDFCMSAWFKADSATHNMTIVGQRRQSSIALGTFESSADKIYFRIDDSAYHYSDNGITIGDWYQVALCYDYVSGTTGNSYMYVNGVAQSTNPTNTYDAIDSGVPDQWQIGDERRWCPTCGSVGPDELFDGIIDEVRMSNTVRSAGWFTTSYENQRDPSSFYQMSNDTCGGQFGFNFTYCKKVTVDYTQVSGSTDLSDFPLLVNITSNDLKSVANGGRVESDQGDDIIFRTSGCAKLEHEIESYDATTGTLVAWVKITTLSASADTEVYMYYGDSSVECPTENPTAVWDSSYVGVFHLKEDPAGTAPQMRDSTGNGYHASNAGGLISSDQISGKIGGALEFDNASDDYVTVPQSLNITGNAVTAEAWVYSPDWSVGGDSVAINAGGGVNSERFFVGVNSGGTLNTRITTDVGYYRSDAGAVATNDWVYIAVRYDGSTSKGYINGAEAHSKVGSGNLQSTTQNGRIGARFDTRRFSGRIDEIRVSNVARSADWIATEYANQSNPNFYSVGSCFEQTMTQTNAWEEEFQ